MNASETYILHVDDDEDILDYVKILLADTATVVSASSPKEAMEMLEGATFNLFILDLILKGQTGASVAHTLKEAHPDTPIVVLSAHDIADSIKEADHVFTKSNFDQATFIKTIQKLLN